MALSGGGSKGNIGRMITFHALFHNGVIEAPKRYDYKAPEYCDLKKLK